MRGLGFSHLWLHLLNYHVLLTLYRRGQVWVFPPPYTHLQTDTQTTLIQLMAQPFSASAGFVFHLREGGSKANRSITKRQRERVRLWWGEEKIKRGAGIRLQAYCGSSRAAWRDRRVEWQDTHTDKYTCSQLSGPSAKSRPKQRQWLSSIQIGDKLTRCFVSWCLQRVSVALCSFLIGNTLFFCLYAKCCRGSFLVCWCEPVFSYLCKF